MILYGNNLAQKMLDYWTVVGNITDEEQQMSISDRL